MPMQQKRWGHDLKRNTEGKYSNPWANRVKTNVEGKTHKAVHYLFCLFFPIIYFFQKLVEVVNAWGMEEYGIQIRVGEAINFWKTCFWLMGQVNAWKCMPIPWFTHVLHFLTQLELVVLLPSCFCCCFLIPSCLEIHFCYCWMNRQ